VVGYVLPHCPYICPKPLFDHFYREVDVSRLPPGYLERLHPAMRLWREQRGVDELTEEQARRARAAYYGLVTLLDENVGRLLATLDETGLGSETAVVYTSDHGEMAGEHGMWWKSSFYEGSVGVPLIWSYPGAGPVVKQDGAPSGEVSQSGHHGIGAFAAGRTVPAIARLLDVAPTLVELGGAAPLPNATGRSLVPWLTGQDVPEWPQEAYAEMAPGLGLSPARMVRKGAWKLSHFHGYTAPQLFNLEADPQEFDDRAGDSSCAGRQEELLAAALDGWSGAEVEAILRRRDADRQVLAAWYRDHRPSDPHHWAVAPEYNVFPEE
jgi:choline-sulfatase